MKMYDINDQDLNDLQKEKCQNSCCLISLV